MFYWLLYSYGFVYQEGQRCFQASPIKMRRSHPLREVIKKRFYPFVEDKGFVRGRATSLFVPFERVVAGRIQVFEIQWDKSHRPRFVINFGEWASSDQQELGLSPVSGRLQRCQGSSIRTWFQISKPWGEILRTFQWSYQPDEVASHLIDCFPELEAWWSSKREGPHVKIWPKRPS